MSHATSKHSVRLSCLNRYALAPTVCDARRAPSGVTNVRRAARLPQSDWLRDSKP
jgi:hypothetical protein